MTQDIVLASTSPFRQGILRDAGIAFSAAASDVDERAVEATLADSGLGPDDVALVLAEAKAVAVSERRPGSLVVGADQTLALGDEIFHKPADMAAARAHLLALSGRTHTLSSAVVIARGGSAIWRHVSVASMTMRDMDPGFIGRHLAEVGQDALESVGAYRYEGPGIQLFAKTEGDYFTIVGLPMIPLLDELRRLGAIDG